jgi:hypothetical protein
MSETKIMIVHETVRDSYISDAGTFGALLISIFVGWLLDSQALQWIAGLMFIIGVLFRSLRGMKYHYTVASARAELDRIEAGIKG